ncbi:MAG TPA: phospholipase D family protein [Pyrinomonadaceae bacterium]|nr:phospholipase D family protein [Pyrinomonadaceae bacterium]
MSGINPEDWFLTSNETRLQPAHTSDNTLVALVDGRGYMSTLLRRLQRTSPGGQVNVAGWRLTPQTHLLGNTANSPSIGDVVGDLVNAGVTVRSLLWFVPGTIGNFGAGHGAENLEMTQLLESLGQQAVLDSRLPSGTFASHHHKFIVVSDATGQTAFIGGIDIAPDRWDGPQHNEPNERERELFDGWHDVQAMVEGPAVRQLWESFAERWNDPRQPSSAPLTAGNSRPELMTERPDPGATGTCHVQVLHTYPCRSVDNALSRDEEFYPFAPAGDRSYEAGLVKAINAAEFFVYLEDQYLWPCLVVDALTAAIARGVSVICLLTNNYDVDGLRPYHNFLRQSCLDQLRSVDPSRVFAFHLQQNGRGGDDIYVHSKTLIIDDRYAVIGTGNINRRSMTTDTEIAVAVVDSDVVDSVIGGQTIQVGAFVNNYRATLWREHLGIPIEDPLNRDGSPAGWPTELAQQVNHVLVHEVPQPCFCRPSFIPFVLMNPETTCQ